LTSISGSLGLVNGGALGTVPDIMRPMLEIAQQNSQRLRGRSQSGQPYDD
jgi:hypothetical protein